MGKSIEEIKQQLDAKIPRDVIDTRDGGGGRKLSYLSGWYVIARLNEVLGQGNWEYDTEEMRLVHAGEVAGKQVAHYIAKVRLTVYGLRGRDGAFHQNAQFSDYGYGDGSDKFNPGKAHELAVKEAVTDGIKRCAKNLGMSLGLALYDKSQEFVDDGEETKKAYDSAPKVSTLGAAKPSRVAGVPGKSEKAVSAPATESGSAEPEERETYIKLIGKQSKVVLDKKKRTLPELKEDMKAYGVAKKEDLSLAQAKEFYAKLQEIANG